MKWVALIIAFMLVGVGIFGYLDHNAKIARAEAAARAERERQLERERAERKRLDDEKVRAERRAALAKEDAVYMLQKYVSRQEAQAKEELGELKLKLQAVEIDQRSLSDELVALEKAEEARAADAKRRKIERREQNERVEALLRSPVLNRLALAYLGEDFSAMRAKFKSSVGTRIKLREKTSQRLAANRKKLDEALTEADKEVSDLITKAQAKSADTAGNIRARVNASRSRVADLRKKVDKLRAKEKSTHLSQWDEKNLERWSSDLAIAEAQLASDENSLGLSEVDALHMKATVAETRARQRADVAIVTKQEDDDEAIKDEMFEGDVYAMASDYENNSLGLVRAAIMQAKMRLEAEVVTLEKKLKLLGETPSNLDLLNADEVNALRETISRKLVSGFAEAE